MKRTIFSVTTTTYLIFQLITRIFLSLYAYYNNQISLTDLPIAFLVGEINDLISLSYFLPVILAFNLLFFLLLSRYKFLYNKLCCVSYFFFVTCLIFILTSEVAFWDEFSTRFNFIAVDYLIYTHEIIGTIKESLPYIEILSTIIILAIIITFFARKSVASSGATIKNQQISIIILFVLSIIAYNFYDSTKLTFNSNRYAQDLSKNGPYEFFSAFFNNSLDYNNFYPQIESKHSLQVVRQNLSKDNVLFIDENSIERVIKGKNLPISYNVIYITVESLSSKFLGSFGNKKNLTPYLDEIAKDSIFFTNIYASGTRTVRGLEAITLSVPPTPGSSIIRRQNNHNLFNIGTVFKNQGYDINFIYGGYSYFDNLENYFHGNGYKVTDRSNLASHEISFSNIWGVADEDIFAKSLEIADASYQNNKPFFSLIMTTSNHRPYTFPDNRIDLPSGSGRSAAVKYTDYAIGNFLEKAKNKPWFNNTIFIISADHCDATAGKIDLPVNKYHIPLIIYAPKILTSKRIDNLASQIDIAPTILGLLGFEYTSKFWGQDILNNPTDRTFISTHQLLGYIKNNYLVVLSPGSQPKTYKLVNGKRESTNNMQDLVEESISFYQTAYEFYISGKMKN